MELTAVAGVPSSAHSDVDDRSEDEGRNRVSMTPVAWQPTTELEIREWTLHGRRLGIVGRGAGWWIGDWLRYGNERFGERYVRPSKITGYSSQTLMNMVYVASRFEPERRRPNLSWSHHAELASLDPADQERWLDRAETLRLSVPCLRDAVRTEQRARRLPSARRRDEHKADLVCPECGCSIDRRRGDARQLAEA